MQLPFVISTVTAVILAGASVRAEQHTIRFENKCGTGMPQLIQGGTVLSSGEDFVSNGPFSAGIAYLQTGSCGFNGENCALLEMTLVNPTSPGAGSSTDISLIAPHAFNVETSFSYFGGCDGKGATCDGASCKTAFFQPNDNQVQVQCEENDVNLLITFCGDATQSAPALTNGSRPISSTVLVHGSTHSSVVSHATSSAITGTRVTTSISTASAVKNVATSSAVPSCRANSARRRRAASPEPAGAVSNAYRRHHARNAEAARRGPSI